LLPVLVVAASVWTLVLVPALVLVAVWRVLAQPAALLVCQALVQLVLVLVRRHRALALRGLVPARV
jgi:hypothetical protein